MRRSDFFGTQRLRALGFGVLIGLATALCGLLVVLTPWGVPFERGVGLNWLFWMRGAVSPPQQVAVVGIHGRTGRALDLPRLPREWPRSIHARLIERLVERGAEVIVFDFDFSRAKPGDEDQVFARAIADSNRVVLFEWLSARRERIFTADGGDGGWTWIEEKQPPTPVLTAAARALAPFPLPKVDQAAFEFWSFKSSAGASPTTAAVALQLKALPLYSQWLSVLKEAGAPNLRDLPQAGAELAGPVHLRRLMVKQRQIFQDDPLLKSRFETVLFRVGQNRLAPEEQKLLAALSALYTGPENQYINFYGPPGTIRTIPYEVLVDSDAISADQRIGDLTGYVLFVGYSDLFDPEQPDHFYTSFTDSNGIDLSGVEIMATAYANLLTQNAVRPSDAAITALCVILFGFLVGLIAYLLPATAAVPVAFALTAAYALFAQWRFNGAAEWLPLSTPAMVQLPLALLIGLLAQYLLERRKEQRMTQAISLYLPENIVRDLTEKQIDPSSVNQVVFGTCLATDMSGFTSLAESMPPKELAAFMNEYFELVAQVLKRHAVDVTEFHADTIMCAWTGPEQSPIARNRAVSAAVEVADAIEQFAVQRSLPLKPRIGLQDGHFYLGHTGGGGRFLYSILGDTANTAARLETLNKQFGTKILAAESVVREHPDLLVRPLGSFLLMGKSDPISVFEVMGRHSNASTDQLALCKAFAQALDAFRSQDWAFATELYQSMLEYFEDDGPTRFYLGHSRRYASEGCTDSNPAVIQLTEK